MRRRHFLQTAAASTVTLASGRDGARADDRRPPVIDTHLHCFAGKDDPRFPYHPEGPYQPAEPATPEHLLECMKEAGVDHAVVVHPEPYRDDHRYLEHCLEVGGGKLKGTCLFFADRPGSLDRMAELVKRHEGKIVAARIHAYAPDRLPPFGTPELRALWKRAGDLGLAVQLHFEPRYAPGFEPLIKEFPETKVVIDHLGRPFQGTPQEYAVVLGWSKLPNTVMKLSSLPEKGQYPHRDVGPVDRRPRGAVRPRPPDLRGRVRRRGHRGELPGVPGAGPLLPDRPARRGPGEGAGRDGGEALRVRQRRNEVGIMRTLSLAGLLLGSLLSSSRAAEEPKRPNVVLIIADDMAWDDCGAFGNPKVGTPNIDKLAREGMRFDRAFVTASSCSPSRSSLITGRYPHNTDAEELHWPLPPEQVTFVEKLRASGYWTAAAGKWHLGNAVKGRFDLVREANPAGFQLGTGKDAKARMTAEGSGSVQSGCDQWVPVLRDRPRDKPFFLWLAALDPHRDYEPGAVPEPHRPEEVVVPPYLPDVPEVRKDLALYYDEIGRLDRHVGEVMAELDRQGEAGNTLVLFLSDNGRPFPRCKTTLYDSGIRTPLIARWPGHVGPGSRCSSLVSTIDIAPTVLKLAGVEPGPSFQGEDLSPLFKDPTAKVRDLIFAERNWHDYAAHGRAARTERYKYIRNDDHDTPLTPPADAVRSPTFVAMRRLRDEGKLTPAQRSCFVSPRPAEELYDVDADPHELVNLAGDPKHSGLLADMREALSQWGRETGDAVPGRLSPDEFDREAGDPLPNRVRPRPTKRGLRSSSGASER